MRPVAALKQSPFEELPPKKNESKKTTSFHFAGKIRANRHKPAFHLILLPQKIVQFTSVLPDHLHTHIFSVDMTNLLIKYAHVEVSLIFSECTSMLKSRVSSPLDVSGLTEWK